MFSTSNGPVADEFMSAVILQEILLKLINGFVPALPATLMPTPLSVMILFVTAGLVAVIEMPVVLVVVLLLMMALLSIVGVPAETTIPAVLLPLIVFVLMVAIPFVSDIPGLLLLIVFPVIVTVGEPAPTGNEIPAVLLPPMVLLLTETMPEVMIIPVVPFMTELPNIVDVELAPPLTFMLLKFAVKVLLEIRTFPPPVTLIASPAPALKMLASVEF